LQAAFPGAKVDVVRQKDPVRRLAIVSEARTHALGEVGVVVEGDDRGEVHLVHYTSEDRRPECRLGGRAPDHIPGSVDCGWRRGQRALATLRAWEERVRAQIGAPPGGKKESGGEIHMKWPRNGYDVFLSLARNEEDGLWAVTLSAIRSGWGSRL
jgi:hypothetical protein